MKTFVSQIYIEPGVKFPFSIAFQQRMSEWPTKLINGWGKNAAQYPMDFDLIFRLSSKSDINEPEIYGPTVFIIDKNVEYTVFLPFRMVGIGKDADFTNIIIFLIDSISLICSRVGIDTERLQDSSLDIATDIVNDTEMFKH
jgi:hypothetical protein